MEEGALVWLLFAVLVCGLLYRQFLVFTRDVPDEYLQEQSVINSTRNPNELAIHQSTKLSYSMGLRVGLEIRYDKYKLRNGNLYDIWELAMGHAKKDPLHAVVFDKERVTLSTINGQARQIRKALCDLGSREEIGEIRINEALLFTAPDVFAVVIACFTSQITVHVHDGSWEHEPEDPFLVLGRENGQLALSRGSTIVIDVTQKISKSTPDTAFENEYTFEKDRGIALMVSHETDLLISARTDFTQPNLVSAVASCIKHIPSPHDLQPSDKFAVVQDKASIEGIVNGLVKILAAFVTGSELIIASGIDTCVAQNPTVILASTETVTAMATCMFQQALGIDRILRLHRLFSLVCNRFSSLALNKGYPDLRLVIAHRSIDSTENSPCWRQIRASLASHAIEETGYFNTAGPILVTDLYDFRDFSKQLSMQAFARGAVAQSNEVKLVHFDGESAGEVAFRGYNVGKAKTVMDHQELRVVFPDEDGFFKLTVPARWGLDGCLYVMKQR